jgi:hypothetical protein
MGHFKRVPRSFIVIAEAFHIDRGLRDFGPSAGLIAARKGMQRTGTESVDDT